MKLKIAQQKHIKLSTPLMMYWKLYQIQEAITDKGVLSE